MNKTDLDVFSKSQNYADGTIIVDSVYEVKESGGILNEGKLAFFPAMKTNSKMKDTRWPVMSSFGQGFRLRLIQAFEIGKVLNAWYQSPLRERVFFYLFNPRSVTGRWRRIV